VLKSIRRGPMQISRFCGNEVHSIEWKNIVKILERRAKFFHNNVVAQNHDLVFLADHNPSGSIIDPNIINLSLTFD